MGHSKILSLDSARKLVAEEEVTTFFGQSPWIIALGAQWNPCSVRT